MLTKLVFIARQDARIQQAFDIYDHREDDNGNKGGELQYNRRFQNPGEWGLTHAKIYWWICHSVWSPLRGAHFPPKSDHLLQHMVICTRFVVLVVMVWWWL